MDNMTDLINGTETIVTDSIVLPADRTQAELLAQYHHFRTEQYRCDDDGCYDKAKCYGLAADRIREVIRMLGLTIIRRKGLHFYIRAN